MAAAYRFTAWTNCRATSAYRFRLPRKWGIVKEAAQLIRPALEELIRQAAQGQVLYNDDTRRECWRLRLERAGKR
jgi:hypothetical protein